jgi:hypothetical protein
MELSAEEKVKLLYEELKEAKKIVSKQEGTFISKKNVLSDIEKLSKNWFNDIKGQLSHYKIDNLDHYDGHFQKLLNLSSGNNRVESFLKHLNALTQDFKKDILIKVQTTKPVDETPHSEFDEILKNVVDQAENEYLKESLGCLKANHLKASVILGWCACIDRVHRKIEELGFDKFNKACDSIQSQKQGRFKRFEKKIKINSINELREVFDNDILWIIEGMGLIDLNQHTRLRSCFDMRCHSAHPGEAPLTKYNILSFFSDIVEIVIVNPKFSLQANGTQQSA